MLSALPSEFCVGGFQLNVAEPVAVPTTWMLNAGKLALIVPSLTLIVMFEYVPTCADVGVPLIRPVLELNAAQAGRFVIVNVSELPSGSAAVGVNEYAVPCVTEAGGEPEIVGA